MGSKMAPKSTNGRQKAEKKIQTLFSRNLSNPCAVGTGKRPAVELSVFEGNRRT